VTVTDATLIGADADEFALIGLPPGGSPLTVPPGGLLAGGLTVRFRPTAIRRVHQAEVDVTFIADPFTQATTTLAVPLYGEGVTTGARLLVTLNNQPVPTVGKIQLQKVQPTHSWGHDLVHGMPLQTVVGLVPELSFEFHREWGGASNRRGLSPGNYVARVTIKVKGKRITKDVPFTVSPCGFNAAVTASF
jgi:hypothetical protein